MVSFFDLIFLTVLVAFIITRLYSVFGSHGENKNIHVVFKSLDKEVDKDLEKKIVENISQVIQEGKDIDSMATVVNIEELKDSEKGLASVPNFNKANFLRSACRVFEMILQAFNSGNIENIRGLVNKKIWDAFSAVLAERKENNITSEVDFICFDKTEIKDVKLLKNSVKVVVEFISEQVNILRNDKGEVIEGDENFVQKITDVWTFERSLNAKSNNWTLVSTKKPA
ncbi:MAG: Tim44 domain-containing protein [Alphaproteobacteria bacterium]|nr:Tim44 domain-containing protein [Alphaproteobacteria bacterium]